MFSHRTPPPTSPDGAVERKGQDKNGRVLYNARPKRPPGCIRKARQMPTRDSNGAQLNDGDAVTLIKDLKVKGTSVTLKRGTLIKNIRLTDDEIECNAEKVKGLVLKTEFLKKVQ